MAGEHLLVSDLDGTLLGDDEGLARFRAWLTSARGGEARDWRIVYATGRSFESVQQLVAAGRLPNPDAIIADVGTRIYDAAGSPWPGWPAWDVETAAHAVRAARRLVAVWPGIRQQADQHQSEWKASFDAPGLDAQAVDIIRTTLRESAVPVTVVYSAARYLDILPVGAGKAAAARFMAAMWGTPDSFVIAAGDSGNDFDLLTAGFRSVIVANSLPDVRRLTGPSIYHSSHPYADGVLEGIEHWAGRLEIGAADATAA